ncbi:flagellar hook-length control protein FliK [Photobacterium sp. 1_MG-2023]|uniref:flagellar hook-length control protein FliK n=1 Tax=Photobacterium sp. 1_MG-2023 TaxID=3062646 RepID=UPI0026E3081D|nr:flagellar hook-length control protein FliK [Photobacterium sp. 1_MG-2023]MDO6705494.1 flagellar hook-length control protein FliK [Photobacterium sp. 1_MG-2023]
MNTIVSHSKLTQSSSEQSDMKSGAVKPANGDKASSFTDTLQSNTTASEQGQALTKHATEKEATTEASFSGESTEQATTAESLTPAVAADIIANLLAQAERQLGTVSAQAASTQTQSVSGMAAGASSVAAMGNLGAQQSQTGTQASASDNLATTAAANERLSSIAQRSQSASVQDSAFPGMQENRAANSSPALQTLMNNLAADIPASASHSQAAPAQAASAANPVEWASVKLPQGQQSKWGEQMMQVLQDRVQLQASQNLQEARIRLDPPELGKLDLTVRLDGDRLSVQIHANQTAVRDALVQVSERLRAELQDQNFVHVDVNVGDGRQGQQQEHADQDSQPVIFANQTSDDNQITTTDSGHWLSTRA